jgi:two-component system, sensor histidine kinase and response regulator
VLMDCQMPEMDGFAATAAIRAGEAQRRALAGGVDGRPAHIPIIAVTAHAMQGDRDASIAAGMDDHLSKPFSLHALRAVLERWMPSSALRTTEGVRLDPGHLAAVRSLKSGGPDLAERVIRLFLDTTPGTMARLRQAASTANAPEMSSAAHSLGGSSRELGALGLGQLCQEVEQLVRGGQISDATLLLPALERELEAVRRLLLEQVAIG